jgi:hypothetical protein
MSQSFDTNLYGTNSAIPVSSSTKNWAGNEFTTNERCGSQGSNKACTGNNCCSRLGYCGTTAAFCAKQGTPEAGTDGNQGDGIYDGKNPLYVKYAGTDNDLENRLFFTLLHKNINTCNPFTSNNISTCNSYYNNLENQINNRLTDEYTNASSYIYSKSILVLSFTNFDTLTYLKDFHLYIKNESL